MSLSLVLALAPSLPRALAWAFVWFSTLVPSCLHPPACVVLPSCVRVLVQPCLSPLFLSLSLLPSLSLSSSVFLSLPRAHFRVVVHFRDFVYAACVCSRAPIAVPPARSVLVLARACFLAAATRPRPRRGTQGQARQRVHHQARRHAPAGLRPL